MNRYIFLTADIHIMGGMQSYVAAKVDYLKKKNWKVNVFFPGNNSNTKTFYNELGDYKEGGIWHLKFPPMMFSKRVINKVIQKIIKLSNITDEKTIIIESQNDTYAMWGELIAEQVEGKNLCLLCNEQFQGDGKYYNACLDFFWYKLKRKELFVIMEESLTLLFGKKANELRTRDYVFIAANEIRVIDGACVELDRIAQDKITICYFGRKDKGYLPYVCKEVVEYATKRQTRKFRFLIVGDGADSKTSHILKKAPDNLEIIEFGGFSPIPKKLFELSDVMIASSGCAYIASGQEKLVIVPDTETGKALGVFGYDMSSTIYNNQTFEYSTLLDEILFGDKYKCKPLYKLQRTSTNKTFDLHMEYIHSMVYKNEYFNFKNVKINKTKKTKIQLLILKLFGNNGYGNIVHIINRLMDQLDKNI